MKQYLVYLISGFIFAIGLGISGMTQPAKIVAFLDVLGNWDPSLVFVMASAVGVYFLSFQLLKKRGKPVFAAKFSLPSHKETDRRLVSGAAIFGIGWGIGGFCPGPVLSSIGTGSFSIFLFIGMMMLGMGLSHWSQNRIQR